LRQVTSRLHYLLFLFPLLVLYNIFAHEIRSDCETWQRGQIRPRSREMLLIKIELANGKNMISASHQSACCSGVFESVRVSAMGASEHRSETLEGMRPRLRSAPPRGANILNLYANGLGGGPSERARWPKRVSPLVLACKQRVQAPFLPLYMGVSPPALCRRILLTNKMTSCDVPASAHYIYEAAESFQIDYAPWTEFLLAAGRTVFWAHSADAIE
jgi:hypothetical protein